MGIIVPGAAKVVNEGDNKRKHIMTKIMSVVQISLQIILKK